MTEAGDFIDGALRYEVSPYSYPMEEADGLRRYGTSVGAIRATVRNTLRRYPGMAHDEIMALASELWRIPVFERRQAAIVLLQSHIEFLVASDLTRIEGFIRSAASDKLVDQLVTDILAPLLAGFPVPVLARVRSVVRRWAADPDPGLNSAAGRLGPANSATPLKQ
jgi:DNA alkylation repair enzyme